MQVGLENNILINELQLGEQLGNCIHAERRADFSLMLAMLTDDVREHSQFSLPVVENKSETNVEQQLRAEFNLPAKSSLALEDSNDLTCFNQAQKIIDNQLASIQLESALTPQAIAFYDNAKRISTEVLTNTSLHCQTRHANSDLALAKRLKFNAKAWLDNIQTSVVNAPLISV